MDNTSKSEGILFVAMGRLYILELMRPAASSARETATVSTRETAVVSTRETLNTDYRIRQLKTLKEAVIAHEEELEDALYLDLRRSKMEAYLTDIGPIIVEINEILHGLKRWARPEIHFSGWIIPGGIYHCN